MIDYLKNIKFPDKDSHKGKNGRLLIVGGSKLFHAASLWSLKVASRIVDLVHYSSVEENNAIVQKLKEEFRDGIIVPRTELDEYIKEDDCILIGPGMVRTEISNDKAQMSNQIQSLKDIEKIKDEGLQTYYLTKYLLQKYPHKKWVIDAGALQMLDLDDIPNNAILTPHRQEFSKLIAKIPKSKDQISNKFQNPNNKKPKDTPDGGPDSIGDSSGVEESVMRFVKQYHCTVLLKGEKDIIASSEKIEIIGGGNAGMTKGGTGDVLAGLVAALYCQNESFTASVAASYINKKAGDALFEKMGYWFNASDLAEQIPKTMKMLRI
ncbi:hypothetical protein A3D03_03845 [Candidatus Gottesmanbacteria bacterium RIFCSPHIGHO2_02_FULL_40_13]|uniref:ADP-dependent (S)-NAD(P)H-hydrate dehydratase n=1 Tax=Candidatus Gottesmanbacteria bacterium RIFCSPHIGHO2_02_FULL_40_13 TaxID=1798384 RepID=A0A1F6A554_9BACT|nr:MAG: hypothetical protein A3D03_03845 [Candidatus Gottesmanbacteria bacterium RIFCSPHIGHO2_02_FULL_40_13]